MDKKYDVFFFIRKFFKIVNFLTATCFSQDVFLIQCHYGISAFFQSPLFPSGMRIRLCVRACTIFKNSHIQSCELMHVERPHSSPRTTRYRTAIMFTVHTERHDLLETAVSTALTFMEQFHNSKALERKERSPLWASIPQENLEKIVIPFFLGWGGVEWGRGERTPISCLHCNAVTKQRGMLFIKKGGIVCKREG